MYACIYGDSVFRYRHPWGTEALDLPELQVIMSCLTWACMNNTVKLILPNVFRHFIDPKLRTQQLYFSKIVLISKSSAQRFCVHSLLRASQVSQSDILLHVPTPGSGLGPISSAQAWS